MSIEEDEFTALQVLLKKEKPEVFWEKYKPETIDLGRVYENSKANHKYKKRNSLLHLICRYNRHDLLVLVKEKITLETVSLRNEAGWTPVAMACRYGALECFEILENCGAKVDQKLGWGSPLILACQAKSTAIVKKIGNVVKDKGYVNYVDDHGVSALYMSIYVGSEDIFFYLIEQGASISLKVPPHNATMLHAACELERKKIIEYLIENGLSLNTTDDQGNTPLHLLCAESEDVKLIRSALAKGGDISLLNKEGEDVYNYTLNHDNVFMAEFLEKVIRSKNPNAAQQGLNAQWIKVTALAVLVFGISYQFLVK